MGNCFSEEKPLCINCIEHENKLRLLNDKIQQLESSVEIKNNTISMLENQIYLLEKYGNSTNYYR
jgi:hypothetical protein